jgi:hypothetical protein
MDIVERLNGYIAYNTKQPREEDDVMRDAVSEITTLRQESQKVCGWRPDGEDTWDTDCKKLFTFNDGDCADNGFEFCPFCGGAISIHDEGDS